MTNIVGLFGVLGFLVLLVFAGLLFASSGAGAFAAAIGGYMAAIGAIVLVGSVVGVVVLSMLEL